MLELGRLYHRLDFSMQLHFGVVRNTNTRQFRVLGPDTGFDSIGDSLPAASLIALLDGLEVTGELPRTVLYTFNPADNAKFASVAGSFQSGRPPQSPVRRRPGGSTIIWTACWIR